MLEDNEFGPYTEEEVKGFCLEYFHGDELAANVALKYLLRDKQGRYLEGNPAEMHERMTDEFVRIEQQFGGPNQLEFNGIYNQFRHFQGIVPQGSPMYGIGNNEQTVSLSNCVVVESPEDDMSSIMDTGKTLANLFKRRCGVGLDISTLRWDGAEVSNAAGTSTGAWSFADLYSYICKKVGQNGRRGALMISMDVRHPDIINFIKMKSIPHPKLKEFGVEEPYLVTGANVSIRITNDFMRAVKDDKEYTLQFPVESDCPIFTKVVKAKEIWDLIVEKATKSGEPGLLMWDNILENLPAECYADVGFKTISTNPCGEIPLSADDSCRLITQNLKTLVVNAFEDNAYFDFDALIKRTRMAMRLSDDLVELELEKIKAIIAKSKRKDEKDLWKKMLATCENGRRTGLGTHGLADALACLNLPYDSDEALDITDKIYETIKIAAYKESINLAKERGPFPVFNWNKEKNNKFIKSLPQDLQDEMAVYGRRNISILTNAPTGSVSIESQTSSGMEPVQFNESIRRRKLSHTDNEVIPDYVDITGERWKNYKVFHKNVLDYFKKKGLPEDSPIPAFFVESDKINWVRRVEIQAVIQKHIDHSISSTINLPKGTPTSVVSNLYMLGWGLGLKGITVYVDGSRSGVILKKEEQDKFKLNNASKRPDVLSCDIHRATIQGEKWIVLVGMLDDKPYEVFAGLSDKIELPKKYDKGKIIKHHRKTNRSLYDLTLGEGEDQLTVKDVIGVFNNPNNAVITRFISLALRHGSAVQYVIEQLQKDESEDFTSFSKVIARTLKKYIKDGEKASSDKICPECSAENIVYQSGCVTCMSCAWTKCS